jgi:hypothetical protein
MDQPNLFTTDQLAQARQECDPLADELVTYFFDQGQAAILQQLMAGAGEWPEVAQAFLARTSALPAWADAGLLAHAAGFFDRHAQAIMSLLGFLSLPYCYAAADGAQVLYRSGRIQADTQRRLAETAQFVLEVNSPGAFAPTGEGLAAVRKVRLMHAAVRYHVRKSGRWDEPRFGPPINQEDMAGTNLAFSFIVLRGLRKVGIAVDRDDAHAYLHLWNVVGWLMGVRDGLLPANERAAATLDRLIASRHFKKSEVGTALTAALLESIQQTFRQRPQGRLPGFVPAYMRFLLGDQVADLLDIPPRNWLGSKLVGVFNLVQAMQGGAGITRAEMLENIKRNHGKILFLAPEKL